MKKTSADTFYEVRLAFGINKELIADDDWVKDELALLVDKLQDTADAFFYDKKIKMGHWQTCAGQLKEEPKMTWANNLGEE